MKISVTLKGFHGAPVRAFMVLIPHALEVLAGAISWGFKSPSPHQENKEVKASQRLTGLLIFLQL